MEKKINIIKLVPWLTNAISNKGQFLLKPNDLKMLYMIVLWEYISKYKNGVITNDEQIAIPEKNLIKIIELFYNDSNYQYFNKVYSM